MATLGIDIGAAFIKFAVSSNNKLEKIAIINNPLGKVGADTEQETDKLAVSLKKALIDNKITEKKARVVISETGAYSRVISMPILSAAELSNAITYEAEQYIPISLSEVELSWEVITKPNKKTGEEKMTVLLVAASKKILNNIVLAFTKIGLELESIETESVATARVLVINKNSTDVTMLVAIGAVSTAISIFNQTNLVFTHRQDSGSAAMTRAIASSLSLPVLQAEEYKRSYGVRTDVLEGKLSAAVSPITTNLINEIKKAYAYITQNNLTSKPTRVVLSGGGSMIPGIIPLISKTTGLEVTIGQPDLDSGSQQASPLFIASIGASRR